MATKSEHLLSRCGESTPKSRAIVRYNLAATYADNQPIRTVASGDCEVQTCVK